MNRALMIDVAAESLWSMYCSSKGAERSTGCRLEV